MKNMDRDVKGSLSEVKNKQDELEAAIRSDLLAVNGHMEAILELQKSVADHNRAAIQSLHSCTRHS